MSSLAEFAQSAKGVHDLHPLDYPDLLNEQIVSVMSGTSIPMAIFSHSKNEYIWSNKSFLQLTGISPLTEVHDRFSWIHPKDHDILHSDIYDQLDKICDMNIHYGSEKMSYLVNFRIRRPVQADCIQILRQTDVLSWNSSKRPELVLEIFSTMQDRSLSEKMVLTVSLFDQRAKANVTIHKQEYTRVPLKLAKREREVLGFMLKNQSATQISKRLNISYYTARAHWRNIMLKMDCHSLTEIRQKALRKGWI